MLSSTHMDIAAKSAVDMARFFDLSMLNLFNVDALPTSGLMKNWFKSFKKKKPVDIPVIVKSDGLLAHGQPEIVLAVLAHTEEDAELIRQHLSSFLDMVETFARDGQFVGDGDISGFGERGFLHPSIKGILYSDTFGSWPEVPDGYLLGTLLFEDEMEVLHNTSPHRILSRIGAQARTYPVPVLSNIDRNSVAHPDDPQSVLAGLTRARVPTMSTLLEDGLLTIRATHGLGEQMAQIYDQLPSLAPLAFVTNPSPVADGRLTWIPGQTEPVAIRPEHATGMALTGCMIVVVPEQDQSMVSLHEDGFALFLTRDDAIAFERAISTENPLDLSTDDLDLALIWAQPEDKHWRTYLPEQGAASERAIVLLNEQRVVERAVDINALSAYLKAVMDAMTYTGTLTISLHPEHAPTFEGTEDDAILTALRAIEPPSITAPLAFQIVDPPEDVERDENGGV